MKRYLNKLGLSDTKHELKTLSPTETFNYSSSQYQSLWKSRETIPISSFSTGSISKSNL